MPSILFVCTGNIFRSLVAEYALKAHLCAHTQWSDWMVGSAGIEARPQPIHPLVVARLQEKGVDPSAHVQRRLTRDLLDSTSWVIAMGRDHQECVRQQFAREIPLFNQVCYDQDEPVLDIHEAVPDWAVNDAAARVYAASVVEHLWNAMPVLVSRVEWKYRPLPIVSGPVPSDASPPEGRRR